MIVILKPHSTETEIQTVIDEVESSVTRPSHPGSLQTVVAAIGDERVHQTLESLNALPQVERVLRVQKRYKLVSRESAETDTVIDVDGVKVGGKNFVIMAGPCSVESEDQLLATARAVRKRGASILRGGAYEPETHRMNFRG